MTARKNRKPWPENCLWPEPTEWSFDYDEETIPEELDQDAQDLLDVKEYYDELRERGILEDDYSLNDDADYSPDHEGTGIEMLANDYWDDGFDYDQWQEDLSNHLNLLKIDLNDTVMDLFCLVRESTGYIFVNENLLRQAFTRRAFAIEYGPEGTDNRTGCCEELEFLGDSVINSIVTKEIIRQFTRNNCTNIYSPFESRYDEGEMTRIREHFIGKDYLAGRARELGLDKYVLYGSAENENDSALEDMMEALIGAIAIDSGFDPVALDRAVNELLYIQLDTPYHLLEKSFYEQFNEWHQKHFGRMPVYEVHSRTAMGEVAGYDADIRFNIPKNDRDIYTAQRLFAEGRTRSLARENVAWAAYRFVADHGLWNRIQESGIEPDMNNSINQLQELYQKKYLTVAPVYSVEERVNDRWYVTCQAEGVTGSSEAGSKVAAKKQAAFKVLITLLSGQEDLANENRET